LKPQKRFLIAVGDEINCFDFKLLIVQIIFLEHIIISDYYSFHLNYIIDR